MVRAFKWCGGCEVNQQCLNGTNSLTTLCGCTLKSGLEGDPFQHGWTWQGKLKTGDRSKRKAKWESLTINGIKHLSILAASERTYKRMKLDSELAVLLLVRRTAFSLYLNACVCLDFISWDRLGRVIWGSRKRDAHFAYLSIQTLLWAVSNKKYFLTQTISRAQDKVGHKH